MAQSATAMSAINNPVTQATVALPAFKKRAITLSTYTIVGPATGLSFEAHLPIFWAERPEILYRSIEKFDWTPLTAAVRLKHPSQIPSPSREAHHIAAPV